MTQEQIKFHERWFIQSTIFYRYMDNKWIEKFFDTGEIQLSSYQKHRNDNVDGIRGDIQEGINIYKIWNSKRDSHIKLERRTGDNNFILCGSYKYDEELKNKYNFDCDGCIKIKNTMGFAAEIAKQIPNYTHGLEGPAKYSPTGEIDIDGERYGIGDLWGDGLDKNLREERVKMAFHNISIRDHSVFFSKREKYNNQLEYRLVWSYDDVNAPESIIVKAPNARMYCEWMK